MIAGKIIKQYHRLVSFTLAHSHKVVAFIICAFVAYFYVIHIKFNEYVSDLFYRIYLVEIYNNAFTCRLPFVI